MERGLRELSQRVARLDMKAGNLSASTVVSSLEHFIRMTSIDFSTAEYGITADGANGLFVSPEAADEVVKGSRLISRLQDIVPRLTVGPLCSSRQYWVAAGSPAHASQRESTLSGEYFADVSKAESIERSSKPFNIGLFTSTGFQSALSMWRVALEMAQSSLFPLPWYTWAVRPQEGTRICEITTASDWAAFVCSNPNRHHELIYPDWQAAAQRYDGIHMTLRAITAIQGIYLRTAQGVIAPAFWDVESTLWLRWCFYAPRLIDVVVR